MQRGGEVDIIKQWMVLANQETDTRRKSNFGLARTFAELTDRSDVWNKALEGYDMRQSTSVNEWKAEGRAEGIAQGKAEGIAESVRVVLEERFGVLPTDLAKALGASGDVKALDQWRKLSVKAATLEQFRQDAGI
jgi:hypothetical protein